MATPPGTFRGSFWETDFTSQNGFDTLVSHMKEGQKSCKWLEDYLRQRAKAEDDYSKALQKISRIERGTHESTTLRKALDGFRVEAETEATLHAGLAQKILEEANKLTDFRDKQKEERKRNEDMMHKTNKHKAEQYRRLQTCKSSYESKFKAAEKAESDAEKLKFGNKARDSEKARKSAVQARNNATKADDEYKTSVAALESTRQTWVRDHSEACDVFQKSEAERVKFVRNSLWVFANLVSDTCCRLDESRERIRDVTEQCDDDADILEFVSQKSTCIAPLQPIEYVSSESDLGPSHVDTNHSKPVANGSHVYEIDSSGPASIYKAIYDYQPASSDELALSAGDEVEELDSSATDDGWMYGLNRRTRSKGFVPRNYVEVA